jgi:flagellar operon protein
METKGLGLSRDFLLDAKLDSIRQRRPEIDKGRDVGDTKERSAAKSFSELLEERISDKVSPKEESLRFSAHAQTRLESRGIHLNGDDMLKLQEAVNKVRDKGSKESLILTDKAAFIVSVKNQTVITAVDRESLKENIFTNIDSTIMI